MIRTKIQHLTWALLACGAFFTSASNGLAEDQVAWIRSHLKWDKGVCLDLGAGDGALSEALVNGTDLNVHAFENDEKILKTLKDRAARSSHGDRFVIHGEDFGVLLGHPRHSTALPQLELARRVVPAKESRCESHVGLALPSSRGVRC